MMPSQKKALFVFNKIEVTTFRFSCKLSCYYILTLRTSKCRTSENLLDLKAANPWF